MVPPLKFGWTPYLWLVYFGFFFVEYLFRRPGAIETAAVIVTVVVFLALYFSAYRRRGRAALIHVGGLALLGVAWADFNAGSSVLFIYAASFAYCVGPPRRSAWVVAAVAGTAALTAWLADPVLVYWLPGAAISVVIGAANIMFSENERKDAELRLSQAEVRRLARVAEHERIAPARVEIEAVEQTARQALTEVRETIGGLNRQGLDEALEHVAASLRAGDVVLDLQRAPGIDPPLQVQAMLSLVIREAVTNILRHADARHCRIELAAAHGGLRLKIVDDGRGGLRLAGEGLSNVEIGKRLCLAEGTVRNYLSEAIDKLNADNRIEAWRIARDHGWL